MKRRQILGPSLLVVLLALMAPASAADTVKYSGSIVSIAEDVGSFVLAEVGPWQIRRGETVVTRRTITLAPDTQYALIARADAAPSGFEGDWVETTIGPEHVYLHDHITVDCRSDGERLVARKITVIEVPDAGAEG